jgi:hypothetical protein
MATKRQQRASRMRHLIDAVSKLNDAQCAVLLEGIKMQEQGTPWPEVEKYLKTGWERLS